MSRDETRSKKRTVRKADSGQVVVGSEIGVTLPIDDTTAHLRFSFWSELYAKNDTLAERKRTAEKVDEFNESELERRLDKYVRALRRAMLDEKPKKKKGSSVRDRVKKRAGYE